MNHTPYPLNADFSGKTICITGATSGIGLACTEAFIAAGATVIGTGRRTERLEALKATHGQQFVACELDVTDREAVFKALAGEQIDILVNNAGLALGIDGADHANLDDWEVMVNTNINGVLYCTKTVLAEMSARGYGHIINIGSIAGSYSYPGGNVYGATKAFLERFSLNLRADLVGKAIRVTNIEPGMVQTDFSQVRFKGDADRAAKVYEGAEALTAEDIAQTVFWAASLPAHVNINRIEVMPVCQAQSALTIARK